MKQLLGIALILAIGLVTSHRWFGRVRLWGRARFFYLTGEEFLLVGLALGPMGFNLLDHRTLASLEPFVGLGLGYLGFIFGMQFHRGVIIRVPGRFLGASLLQSVLVGAILAAALSLVLPRFAAAPPGLAAALAAAGMGTSTAFLYLVDRGTNLGRNPAFRFLRFSSVLDDLWGVILFGLALCWMRGEPLGGLGLTLGLAAVSAGVLLTAARLRLKPDEELLVLLGAVLLTGGLAAYLRLSPILTNALAGIAFANLQPGGERYHERLLRVEKPIYLFMLVVAGAWWSLGQTGLLVGVAVYVAARALAKWVGGVAAGRVLAGGSGGSLGFAVLAQSEMGVAMMVNLLVLYPHPAVVAGVSAVLVAVIVNDMVSSLYFGVTYRRA